MANLIVTTPISRWRRGAIEAALREGRHGFEDVRELAAISKTYGPICAPRRKQSELFSSLRTLKGNTAASKQWMALGARWGGAHTAGRAVINGRLCCRRRTSDNPFSACLRPLVGCDMGGRPRAP